MRAMFSRLRPNAHALEHLLAALLILIASLQFGVAVSDGRHRGAHLALLVMAMGLYWHRSIFRRRASRDVAKAVAGLAQAAAMTFLRVRRDGDQPVEHPDRGGSVPRDVVRVRSLFISDVHLGTKGC